MVHVVGALDSSSETVIGKVYLNLMSPGLGWELRQTSLIPAKTSGFNFKFSSWVFDGCMKRQALTPVKEAGIDTCSSWISRENKLRRIQRLNPLV